MPILNKIKIQKRKKVHTLMVLDLHCSLSFLDDKHKIVNFAFVNG
jgi:hypothetical protein